MLGTDEDEFFLVDSQTVGTADNTIQAGGGDDFVLADAGKTWLLDRSNDNGSVATAFSLEADANAWTTVENPLFRDSSIPHTTAIVETTIGQTEFFAVAIGAGQTITIDIDFGSGTPIGHVSDVDLSLRNAGGSGFGSDDESLVDEGGLGSFPASPGDLFTDDPFFTYTALTGGIYYIVVSPHVGFFSGFADNVTFMMNVSVTGHAVGTNPVQGNDIIEGGAGDDSLIGGGGDDLIQGGLGNDLIHGGSGENTVHGGDGNDTLHSGGRGHYFGDAGDDLVYAGPTAADANEILDGGDGVDTLNIKSSNSAYSVNLGSGTTSNINESFINFENVITGNGADTIVGTDGANRIETNDGADTVLAGAGDDFLFGGGGKDILDGGAGTGDWASYIDKWSQGISVTLTGASDATVTVGGVAEDTIRNIENIEGGWANDVLTGDGQANRLIGLGGNDILRGFAGDDYLSGGDGKDILDGGSGMGDWADYSDVLTRSVLVVLNGANDSVVTVKGVAEDTIRNIENVQGGLAGDRLVGDALANELHGLSGNDILRGGGGNDILDGGDDGDYWSVYDGVWLDYNRGWLGGYFGDWADYGDKTVAISAALDAGTDVVVLVGGVAEDIIRNIENLHGGSAGDVLTGNDLVNQLWGWEGNDFLRGGGGKDVLSGGAGIDWADYSDKSAAVSVTLQWNGTSLAMVEGVMEDTLYNIENLQGGSGNDVFVGNSDANELRGLDGNDSLTGDAGNDTLTGGTGDDVLDGGAGQDTAFFSGNYAQYSIVVSGLTATLVGPDGTDIVSNVETFIFNDRTAAITGAVRNDDFNGDSKADILWRHDTGTILLWNSIPAAGVGFTGQDIGVAGNDWHIQDAADFNGDGKADFLWRHDNGTILLWNSTAGGGLTGQDIGVVGNDWHIQDAADFNGDAKADFLWRHDNGTTLLWNSTAGGGFTGQDIVGAGNDWHIQDAADFNGDGKADILWRNDNGTVSLWNSTPAAGVSLTRQDIGVIGSDWHVQDAADFNGDGKADILWRHDSGTIYLWNSTATMSFTGQDLGVIGNDWQIQEAADFNSDGKADILWRNDNGTAYLWNSTAGVGFTGQDFSGVGSDWQIQA